MNARFDEVLLKRRTLRKRTPPHTPEQNGQAERAVRTIKERMCTMLLQAGLGSSFWGKLSERSCMSGTGQSFEVGPDGGLDRPFNGRQPLPRLGMHCLGSRAKGQQVCVGCEG